MTTHPSSSERCRLERWENVRAFLDALADRPDAPVRGAWTPGQIVFRLAAAIELSSARRPADQKRRSRLLRWPLRLVILRRGLPRGRSMPAEALGQLTPPTDALLGEQRERPLRAITAFERVTHLRHCELPLGMVDPRAIGSHDRERLLAL